MDNNNQPADQKKEEELLFGPEWMTKRNRRAPTIESVSNDIPSSSSTSSNILKYSRKQMLDLFKPSTRPPDLDVPSIGVDTGIIPIAFLPIELHQEEVSYFLNPSLDPRSSTNFIPPIISTALLILGITIIVIIIIMKEAKGAKQVRGNSSNIRGGSSSSSSSRGRGKGKC